MYHDAHESSAVREGQGRSGNVHTTQLTGARGGRVSEGEREGQSVGRDSCVCALGAGFVILR